MWSISYIFHIGTTHLALVPMIRHRYKRYLSSSLFTEYPITGRGVVGEIPVGYSDTPLENLCVLDLLKAAEEREIVIEKFTPLLSGK